VFEPKRIFTKYPEGDPTGHIQLPLVGKVTPSDPIENFQYGLGGALEELPYDQALLRTQNALDYLNKILFKLEHKFDPPKEESTRTLLETEPDSVVESTHSHTEGT
jgi:hypothetical protein